MTNPDPGAFWLQWQVGERVVVRYRTEDGGFSDALGELVRVDATGVDVVTRRGVVSVEAADIALGKRVPPPPEPRRRRSPPPPGPTPVPPRP